MCLPAPMFTVTGALAPQLSWRGEALSVATGLGIGAALILMVLWLVGVFEPRSQASIEFEESVRRAQLVRICQDGTRIYRLDGQIVTLGWGIAYFAPGTTPESACF
jgi:hypothetical protein